jgi:hypothetical protein
MILLKDEELLIGITLMRSKVSKIYLATKGNACVKI